MLKSLLRVRFAALLAAFTGQSRKRGRQTKGKAAGYALLMLYCFCAFVFLFYSSFSQLAEAFFPAGLGWLYFAMFAIMAFALMFIGSVFTAKSQLFEAKDNELLLSMPVRPGLILLSRMAAMLAMNFVFELVVALPVFAAWLRFGSPDAAGIAAFVLIVLALRKEGAYQLKLREIRFTAPILKNIIKIGLPAGIQTAIFSLSNIIIQSAINSLGTVVMAASSAAFNIEIIAYDVLNSFSQACTTFVGQNYGAGKIDRCKKTMFLCLIEDFIASAAAIALVLLTGKYILAIFNSDPEVIAIGYTRLLFLFGSYIFTLTYEILSGYLRGFGMGLTFAPLNLFSLKNLTQQDMAAAAGISNSIKQLAGSIGIALLTVILSARTSYHAAHETISAAQTYVEGVTDALRVVAVITLAALLPLLWVFRKKRPEKSGVKGAATPSPGEAVSGKTDKTTIYRTKPE